MTDQLTTLRAAYESMCKSRIIGDFAAHTKHVEITEDLRALIASMEAQPEQEPVAIVDIVVPHLYSIIVKHVRGSAFPEVGDMLYTHAAQPASEQIKEVVVHADYRQMWAEVVRQNQQLCAALSAQTASEPEDGVLLKQFLSEAKKAGITHLNPAQPAYSDKTWCQYIAGMIGAYLGEPKAAPSMGNSHSSKEAGVTRLNIAQPASEPPCTS